MISLLLNIIAVWIGVLGEAFLLELMGISLFMIMFIFFYEKIDAQRALIITAIVSIILDVEMFLPIGSHMMVAGISYLVYIWVGNIIEGNRGFLDSITMLLSFIIYYLFMNLITIWSDSGISFKGLGWINLGSVILSSVLSTVILSAIRALTTSVIAASHTTIKIRR